MTVSNWQLYHMEFQQLIQQQQPQPFVLPFVFCL